MRTDIHRPSAISPEDYEYVAQEVHRIEGMMDIAIVLQNRETINNHMKRTGGTYSGHTHGGNCMVCGSANAIYTVLFYHAKTNSYVRMGQDCAIKCECGSAEDFRNFREHVKAAMACKAGKAKAQLILAEAGLSKAWDIYLDPRPTGIKESEPIPFEEFTTVDIVGKLVQYGSLSDNQFSFLKKLVGRIDTRAERKAKQEAENAAAKPIPGEGRYEIVGTVISVKFQESDFGTTLKMLVKHEDGWKVWGTVPSILEVNKGDVVKFKATVQLSKDDPKFGFFKRPACAEVVKSAE